MLEKILKKLFGDKNSLDLKRYEPLVPEINGIYEGLAQYEDDQLRARIAEIKSEIADKLQPKRQELEDIKCSFRESTDDNERNRIDNQIDNTLPLSGGTLTGTLNSRDIIPTSNDTYDLGSSTYNFDKLYVDSIYGGSTEVMQVGLGTITAFQNILPYTDDTLDCGTSSYRWEHVYCQQLEAKKDIFGEANLQLTKSTGAIIAIKDSGGTTRYLTCQEDPDHSGKYILTT